MAGITPHKKKAWQAFSAYIRTRDCVAWSKSHPEVFDLSCACVTCGRIYPYSKLQAGHFLAGRRNAVLFSEKGVHAQCYGCNISKKGNTEEYWLFMEKTYGREEIDRQLEAKKDTIKYSASDFDEIAFKYTGMRLELLKTL